MADDKYRVIRDYVVLTPQVIQPRIVRLEVQAANFEFKPVMFQILQTVRHFNGLPSENPHIHFISGAFKIAGASQDALRLIFFSLLFKRSSKRMVELFTTRLYHNTEWLG